MAWKRRAPVVAGAIVVLVFEAAACGSPLNSAGEACSDDAACAAGLTCLDVSSLSAGKCSTRARVCSKSCRTNGDCQAVGDSFKCVMNCGGSGVCIRGQ